MISKPSRSRTAVAVLLLAATAVAEAQDPGTAAGPRFTAQNRPRVAVLKFKDANREAAVAGYAGSVEAMLVTFFQSQSQLAVVERQELSGLYEEKRRIQKGLVDAGDGEASELLQKTDALISGTVTLLEGSRVEIDTKLLSGFDGRVVATAQRSGPQSCLREVVAQLGAALVQDLLRPYQGSLKIQLTSPENVQIFLTPIPLDTAPGAEKVPAEQSATMRSGQGFGTVEPWMTSPTSYTIESLLSGWYSLRLVRLGYEDWKTEAQRFEARWRSGRLEVFDRTTGLPWSRMAPELRRFVVSVEPQRLTVIDGDTLGVSLRKTGGSLAVRVKRKYLDLDFSRIPQRVILMGGAGLDLNLSARPEEAGKASSCNLLKETSPRISAPSRTVVAPGQKFDFDAFRGGELIIEDYRGEVVPTGQYQVAAWEPHYRPEKIPVTVRDGDHEKKVQIDLARETLPLTLEVTGPRPGRHVFLKGKETRHEVDRLLDDPKVRELRGLPADTYRITTDIPGLDGGKRTYELTPGKPVPPRYFPKSSAFKPEITKAYEDSPVRPSSLIVKTRLVLAGRLDLFSRGLNLPSDDLFRDEEVARILDDLFPPPGSLRSPPDDLRRRLAQRLEVVDLLVLHPRDMSQLRSSPETAARVQEYVKMGGALFAFLTAPGDYSSVVGASLEIEAARQPAFRSLFARPLLPKLSKRSGDSWREIVPLEDREALRVLERGDKSSGGYVALWLDDPVHSPSPSSKTAPGLERALQWARYLMYRRYDKTGKLHRQAEEGLGLQPSLRRKGLAPGDRQ